MFVCSSFAAVVSADFSVVARLSSEGVSLSEREQLRDKYPF